MDRKLKVLVVDDEVIVRVGLKSVIDWEENGFQLIGEASNGKQAFEIIIQDIPDIVVTDIKMPVMDGIELIRRVRNERIDIRFIILSCHDDFDLVKEAMKLGAEEYFIKLSMEADDLLKVLLCLKDKIDQSNKEMADRKLAEDNIKINLPVLRERFFYDLTFSSMYKSYDLAEKMKLLGINIIKGKMSCLVMWIDGFYKYENYSNRDMHLLDFSVLNIVREILDDFKPGYIFKSKEGEFTVIHSEEGLVSESDIYRNVFVMADRIKNLLKKYLDVSVSIGVSNINYGLESIRKAYNEAADAVRYRYFMGSGSIISFNEIGSLPIKTLMEVDCKIDELVIGLRELDETRSNKLFIAILQTLDSKAITREKAQMLCMKLVIHYLNFIQEQGEPLDSNISGDYDPNKDVRKLETLGDVKNWILWLKETVNGYISGKSENRSKSIIVKAQKYISEHFNEDISLNDVAIYLNITAGYLSSLFRKEMGECLTDYLTSVRIEKAKEYIKGTNMKMYEIADTVGYSNIYYFSKVFKKVTGLSPLEYKEKC